MVKTITVEPSHVEMFSIPQGAFTLGGSIVFEVDRPIGRNRPGFVPIDDHVPLSHTCVGYAQNITFCAAVWNTKTPFDTWMIWVCVVW